MQDFLNVVRFGVRPTLFSFNGKPQATADLNTQAFGHTRGGR